MIFQGNTKGFSATEVAVSIVMVAILAALSMPYLTDLPDKTRDAKIQQDMLQFRRALIEYSLDTKQTRGVGILFDVDPFWSDEGFVSWALMSKYYYLDDTVLTKHDLGGPNSLAPMDPYDRPYIIYRERYLDLMPEMKESRKAQGLENIDHYYITVGIESPSNGKMESALLFGRGPSR